MKKIIYLLSCPLSALGNVQRLKRQLFAFDYAVSMKRRMSLRVYKWEVAKSNFFASLIAFSAISYKNVTHRSLMFLLPLPHLPCGYMLPANCLLVRSNDKLTFVIAICCCFFIFQERDGNFTICHFQGGSTLRRKHPCSWRGNCTRPLLDKTNFSLNTSYCFTWEGINVLTLESIKGA